MNQAHRCPTTDRGAPPRRTCVPSAMPGNMPINIDPNRVPLYDVYGDVEVDMHLTGCVGQRKGYVLNKSFRIVDRKGVENPDLTAVLNPPGSRPSWTWALNGRSSWDTLSSNWGDVVVVDGVTGIQQCPARSRLLYMQMTGRCGTDHWWRKRRWTAFLTTSQQAL